jgi:hypothetical protein
VVHHVGLQLVLVVHDNEDILMVRTQLSVILAVCLSILVKIFIIREENYLVWSRWFSSGAQRFFKIKTVCLQDVTSEMLSFAMRPAKYFYDKLLPKYLDS